MRRGTTVFCMGDVVLVHGAYIDSSCWASVAGGLRERGHRVAAVDLHQGTLAADTEVAQQAVDSFGGAVVACGWSYGGMVITGLEVPQGSHLVYLCSVMPDEGENITSLLEGHTDLDRLAQLDDSGDVFLAGDELDEIVWADAPQDARVTASASLRSQALQSLADSPTRVSWRDVPSTFVVGTQDRCIHPDFQREMAKRASDVIEWDTSHSPPLSRPDLLVELLDRLATL
jgi:pimeloyl-ACP methyl ester carboxylesterase